MSSEQIDRVRSQFGRQAEAYARMRQTRDREALRGLVALAGARAGEAALDVACGPGDLACELARAGLHTTGVDATDACLRLAREAARREGLSDVHFEPGEAEALPFPDERFDLVTCRAAFHHFARPQGVLAEMRRVARPGGRLMIADMLGSEDPQIAEVHDRIERLCDPSHVRALPASTFQRLFASQGLRVVRDVETRLDNELEEWLSHGGPGPEAEARIRELFAVSLAHDGTGLAVRREGESIHFQHTARVYLLAKEGR